MRYEFFRALSALRFKSALSAYEPTMNGIACYCPRPIGPRAATKKRYRWLQTLASALMLKQQLSICILYLKITHGTKQVLSL